MSAVERLLSAIVNWLCGAAVALALIGVCLTLVWAFAWAMLYHPIVIAITVFAVLAWMAGNALRS